MGSNKQPLVILIGKGIFLIVSLLLISSSSHSTVNHEIVTDMESLLNIDWEKDDKVLIDLRDHDDYVERHIEGAINIPYKENDGVLSAYLYNNDYQGLPIYLVGYDMVRPAMAFNQLSDLNYKELFCIRYGVDAYLSLEQERVASNY